MQAGRIERQATEIQKRANLGFRVLCQRFVILLAHMSRRSLRPLSGSVVECPPKQPEMFDIVGEFPALREVLLEARPAILEGIPPTNDNMRPRQHGSNGAQRTPITWQFVRGTWTTAAKASGKFQITLTKTLPVFGGRVRYPFRIALLSASRIFGQHRRQRWKLARAFDLRMRCQDLFYQRRAGARQTDDEYHLSA